MTNGDTSVHDTPRQGSREIRFHARVEKGHRIAIPASERAAGAIVPGDLVQVTIVKLHAAQGASQ